MDFVSYHIHCFKNQNWSEGAEHESSIFPFAFDFFRYPQCRPVSKGWEHTLPLSSPRSQIHFPFSFFVKKKRKPSGRMPSAMGARHGTKTLQKTGLSGLAKHAARVRLGSNWKVTREAVFLKRHGSKNVLMLISLVAGEVLTDKREGCRHHKYWTTLLKRLLTWLKDQASTVHLGLPAT